LNISLHSYRTARFEVLVASVAEDTSILDKVVQRTKLLLDCLSLFFFGLLDPEDEGPVIRQNTGNCFPFDTV
jgi:hypothetical protein